MTGARSQSQRDDAPTHELRVVRDDGHMEDERRAGGLVHGRAGSPAPSLSALHKRLWILVGDRSIREVARMTENHPETVRRYLRGHQPSLDFVIQFSRAFSVRIDWLLLGEGPRFPDELVDWAARSPEFPELVRRAYDIREARPKKGA